MGEKNKKLLEVLKTQPSLSSKEIHERLGITIGYATVKRLLSKLVTDQLVVAEGRGKGTKYSINPSYELFFPMDVEDYFSRDIDERAAKTGFNHDLLLSVFPNTTLFSETDLNRLNSAQQTFQSHVSELSEAQYTKEMERLAIDLSWKSSQIEGNTYSLLETERLLKEKVTADGKPKDDAIMLLNHKEAMDFLLKTPQYLNPLTVARIEDVHSILTKELGIDRNIRQRRVGISGTNYHPLDNEFQIREALEQMCGLCNKLETVFEKAFLVLLLISYIQPFFDGNKRTTRIVSNALLLDSGSCPLSFRTVDSIEYKKAMLLFYEQNNLQAMKNIFIEQYEFAVETYF